MRITSALSITFFALCSIMSPRLFSGITLNTKNAPIEKESIEIVKEEKNVPVEEITDFEKAVQLIKKYEGLHQPRHYPLVGYGHLVLPGEKFSRTKAMSEKEAEALLRKDLLKNCAVFRAWGPDSLLLGVLAYNIGSGNVLRSTVAKKLKAGDRDIYSNFIAHCKYRGKEHKQIKQRRIEEFEQLFIKDINKSKDETVKTSVELETAQLPGVKAVPAAQSNKMLSSLFDNILSPMRSYMTPFEKMSTFIINKDLFSPLNITSCISKCRTYYSV